MVVSLTRIGDILIIRAPYHPLLVAEIKRIPGRKYSGPPLRVWSVPAQYEEQIRAIVRNYFPIEDEPNVVFEGAPEPLEGPFAVLKLEFIGENREDRSDRIASTIRHNRARGKHQIQAMSEIVQELARRNWTDAKIARELGMDPDEVLRLKQISGLAEFSIDREFSEAWEITESEQESTQ